MERHGHKKSTVCQGLQTVGPSSGRHISSTAVLTILKLRLVFALSTEWSIFTFDITTSFLHAILNADDDPILVWPPEEYFPKTTLVWRLYTSSLRTSNRPTKMAEMLRGRMSEAGIQTTQIRRARLCSHDLNCHHRGVCDDRMVFGELVHMQEILQSKFGLCISP